MAEYSFELSDTQKLSGVIDEHVKSHRHPFDSWLEDRMLNCAKFALKADGIAVGYCGLTDGTLSFFHVLQKHFKHAPALLETFISQNAVERVFVMTQDSALCALISEWDYDAERDACFFIDADKDIKAASAWAFRTARPGDCERIREVCTDFFEDASCGYNSLEERIEDGTIFMLEDGEELLGCGIAKKGIFCKG